MLLVGENNGISFKYKDLQCLLNDRFNIILFTEHTAVYNDVAHSLGFIIPISYASFISTINKKYTYKTDLSEIFEFSCPEDKNKMKDYVSRLKESSVEKLPDLIKNILKKSPKIKRIQKKRQPK